MADISHELKAGLEFAEKIIFGGNASNAYKIPADIKGNSDTPECIMIRIDCKLDSGEEQIQMYNVSIGGKIITVLTNKRFIQITRDKQGTTTSSVRLQDIQQIYHTQRNIFRWDKLIIQRANDTIVVFEIYYRHIAKFFGSVLCKIVMNIHETNEKLAISEKV